LNAQPLHAPQAWRGMSISSPAPRWSALGIARICLSRPTRSRCGFASEVQRKPLLQLRPRPVSGAFLRGAVAPLLAVRHASSPRRAPWRLANAGQIRRYPGLSWAAQTSSRGCPGSSGMSPLGLFSQGKPLCWGGSARSRLLAAVLSAALRRGRRWGRGGAAR